MPIKCIELVYVNNSSILYSMKIKEQTRKLAQTVLEYGKAKLTWFEEIFEEYKIKFYPTDPSIS